jgi:hypothetical protein
MAGIGLNSIRLDQAGSRAGRFLDVAGDPAATVAGGATAHGGAVVQPFHPAGIRLRDAGASIEMKRALLVLHQKVKEELAIEVFQRFAA